MRKGEKMKVDQLIKKLKSDKRLSVNSAKEVKFIFVEAPVGIKTWGRLDYLKNKHNYIIIKRYDLVRADV